MVSRIFRRSGNAVVEYLNHLGWKPLHVIMVGVGGHHEEVQVMREAWAADFELYGFEANPLIFKDLQQNFPGFAYHYAVGNSDAAKVPVYFKGNWKDGTTTVPQSDSWNCELVPAVRLDRAPLPSFNSAEGLLWLDCEGGELNALVGGQQFIADHIKVINCEMTGRPTVGGWPTAQAVHYWLISHGFYQAWTHTIRPRLSQFDAIYLRGDLFDPSLTCCMDSVHRHLTQWDQKVHSNPRHSQP